MLLGYDMRVNFTSLWNITHAKGRCPIFRLDETDGYRSEEGYQVNQITK